jgi:hypothetical protein
MDELSGVTGRTVKSLYLADRNSDNALAVAYEQLLAERGGQLDAKAPVFEASQVVSKIPPTVEVSS